MNTPDWLIPNVKRRQRRRKGCWRRMVGCLFFLTVALLLLLALFVWLATPAGATPGDSLAVWLVMDNSNSMFEANGSGTDPQLLRLDAARLFISYLGAEGDTAVHQCGVIFFGTEAEVMVPLTPLTDEQMRMELFARIANPAPIGWTDHVAALRLAYEQAQANQTGRPAIVLLTDGQPEWDSDPTEAEQIAYLAELETIGEQLHAAAIPLFIILLTNDETALNPAIAQTWQPIWQRLTAATPSGRFYLARQAEDLMAIYHDTVVALTGAQTAGVMFQETVSGTGMERVITVEPNLGQLTLVIGKTNPEVEATIWMPDGQMLTRTSAGVRYAGQPGVSREEIWSIPTPLAGLWRVQINGTGQVTVWKDYQILPTLSAETPATTPITLTTIIPTVSRPTSTPLPSATSTSVLTPLLTVGVAISPGETGLPDKSGSSLNNKPTTGWLWGLPLVLLLVGLGYQTWHKWLSPPSTVTGAIRVLAGPGASATPSLLELDSLGRREITIGPDSSDFPLPGATGTIILRSGPRLDGVETLLIQGRGSTFINNEPLSTSQSLTDSALIVIGLAPDPVYRLRYENLRLRPGSREVMLADW